MKAKSLLLLLFILAAQSSKSAYEHRGGGSIESNVILRIGGSSLALPVSLGTNVVSFNGFVFPQWVEPDLSKRSVLSSSQFIQTNSYDMIIQWDVSVSSLGADANLRTYGGWEQTLMNYGAIYPDEFVLDKGVVMPIRMATERPHLNNGLKYSSGYLSVYTPSYYDLSIDLFSTEGRMTGTYTNEAGLSSQTAIIERSVSYIPTYLGYVTNSLRVAGLGGAYYLEMGDVYKNDKMNYSLGTHPGAGPTNWVHPDSSLFNPLNARMAEATQSAPSVAWLSDTVDETEYTVLAGSPTFGIYTNAEVDFWSQIPYTNIYTGVRVNYATGDQLRLDIDDAVLEDGVAYYLTGHAEPLPGADANSGVSSEVYYKDRNRGFGTLKTAYVGVGDELDAYVVVKSQPSQTLITGGTSDPSDVVHSWTALIEPDSRKRVFMRQDLNPSSYTRNPNCWLYGLNLTPFSPWNSSLSTDRGGALISPRHYICAHHWQIGIGSTIRFVTQNNEIVERSVIGSQQVWTGDRNNDGLGSDIQRDLWVSCPTDIRVLLLDSDVPSTIVPCKVLPQDYLRWLPAGLVGVPYVWMDKVDYATAAAGGYFDTYFGNTAPSARQGNVDHYGSIPNFGTTMLPNYLELYWETANAVTNRVIHPAVDRDSGNPIFTFINDDAILIGCFHTGVGTSYAMHEVVDAVNGVMTELGGGYQLEEVDLEALGFPEYKLTESR